MDFNVVGQERFFSSACWQKHDRKNTLQFFSDSSYASCSCIFFLSSFSYHEFLDGLTELNGETEPWWMQTIFPPLFSSAFFRRSAYSRKFMYGCYKHVRDYTMCKFFSVSRMKLCWFAFHQLRFFLICFVFHI